MSRPLCPLLAFVFASSCLVVPEGSRPQASLSTVLASQYNFRGIANVDAPVLQTEMVVDLPTHVEEGLLSFRGWANWDLSNDAGDAWFPDGHGGEPSQIDLMVSYSEHYRGFDVTSGIVSYALQNPDDFPFTAERGETKELFVDVRRTLDWQALTPSITFHYDIDEVEDLYLNVGLSKEFPIDERMAAEAGVTLGYSSGDQAEWDYGVNASGLSDLQARGRLLYFLDQNTTLSGSLHASTFVNDDIEEWLDQIGLEENNVWATLGVTWAY